MRWFLLVVVMLVVAPASAARAASTILVLGDSISAGYGLAQGEGWVALLEQRLLRDKLDYRVVNASISGDTTLGGLNRIEEALKEHRPAVVVVALGGNDGLRGSPLDATRSNLIGIVKACRKAGAKVVIAGIRVPRTTAPCTRAAFKDCSPRLLDSKMLPWFLSCSAGLPRTARCFRTTAFIPLPPHSRASFITFIGDCDRCCSRALADESREDRQIRLNCPNAVQGDSLAAGGHAGNAGRGRTRRDRLPVRGACLTARKVNAVVRPYRAR